MTPLAGTFFLLVAAAAVASAAAAAAADNIKDIPHPRPLRGDVGAVYSLIDRVLPTSQPPPSDHFDLRILDDDSTDDGGTIATVTECAPGVSSPCFSLSDDMSDPDNPKLIVQGTTASELTAGLGRYLRQHCNMTIGWRRGGGSHVFLPTKWPTIGPNRTIAKRRHGSYSYLMNVCTHSYSLVWYSWTDWERFIDWMALSGINLFLAMTGQEELQYKVFRKLGLSDEVIRNWFNGPALLTWSRGQNEYGAGLLGPLPRSWMKQQWTMQREHILPRVRSLGITGQLPGFQGNVPVELRALWNDTNITVAGATGWMDSLDPLFGHIADLWMQTLIADFGTDHWYQLDGYFDGGTAPWLSSKRQSNAIRYQATSVGKVSASPPRDEMAFKRASSAYQGLNRTDPHAIWSFQGWAIIGWNSVDEASTFKGFSESTPPGKFVVIDMSPHGEGQWRQFNTSAFYGANFVFTALHNFGGTDGLKGDLSRINRLPFDAPRWSNMIGTGATPEGIDQNPLYYDFIFHHAFDDEPVSDLVKFSVDRSYRRYGLSEINENVQLAWAHLAKSAYSVDEGVQDATGVAHLPPPESKSRSWFWNDKAFEDNRYTPKPILCHVYQAWGHLIEASEAGDHSAAFTKEPFTYDLVNTGREVLAKIATPASLNFSDAFSRKSMNADELKVTGSFYISILRDLDMLVGTDSAFLLGPWIESARQLGTGSHDCASSILDNSSNDCENFLEWNARSQITTWKPVAKDSTSIPDGPIDYASKHWQGLIKDYYLARAKLTLGQALLDQSLGKTLNKTAVNLFRAKLAHQFTTARIKYPTSPIGEASTISRLLFDKYASWFAPCEINEERTSSSTAIY